MAWSSVSARVKNWGAEILTDTDLEADLDVLHTYINDMMNSTTGHKHDGTTAEGPKIVLTSAGGISGVLPLANGGTGQATLSAFLNLIYPVGSIYTNAAVSTNPATLLGFGTWTAFGAGKVMVSLDSGDADFDTLEETGGAKTVNIAHTHTVPATSAVWGSTSPGTTGYLAVDGADSGPRATIDAATSSSGSATQSVVQPYIVVYMWKRTV